jgi:signal transduction histidine kinase
MRPNRRWAALFGRLPAERFPPTSLEGWPTTERASTGGVCPRTPRLVGAVRLLSRLRRGTPIVDVLVALAIAVVGLSDVLQSDLYRPTGRWLGAILLTSAALLFSRRQPVIVLAVVLVSQAAVHVTEATDDPAFQFLATFAACFAVGAYARMEVSVGSLAGAVVFFAIYNLSRGADWDTAVFGGVLFWTGWTLGLALRISARRKNEAETRARRLEVEGEERTRAAVADERARIARELHDAVAHSVSVMVLQVGAVRRRLREEQHSEREMLSGVEQTGREAVAELQRMLGLLRHEDADAFLAARPSLTRLDELVEQVRSAGLPIEVTVEGETQPLPTGVDVSAYRIIQEALTNVMKHSGGGQATVHVRYNATEIELEVIDNGRGGSRTDAVNGVGHGLVGMRERVALFGGRLEAGPVSEGGFAVRARLPVR